MTACPPIWRRRRTEGRQPFRPLPGVRMRQASRGARGAACAHRGAPGCRSWSEGGGRTWVRTTDPFDVNEVLYR